MRKVMFVVLVACVCAAAWGQQAVVAVAPFEAKSGISSADANTVTEIYSLRLAATRSVRVVTRDNLDKVVREHSFQMSDWSNDSKTAELARALNADWVVRGTLQKLDNWYVVTATLLDVKTHEIMGGADMRLNSIGDAYDEMGPFVAQTVQTITGIKVAAGGAAKEYKIGDFGPAGGWVFYDKGVVSNGWRYLEAAPAGTEFRAVLGTFAEDVRSTSSGIGMGKRNTQVIVEYLRQTGEINTAAQLCDELTVGENGYDGWFLPSKNELNLMYTNLKAKGLGEFGDGWYWSSELYHFTNWVGRRIHGAWLQNFSNGEQNTYNAAGDNGSARAIRAF